MIGQRYSTIGVDVACVPFQRVRSHLITVMPLLRTQQPQPATRGSHLRKPHAGDGITATIIISLLAPIAASEFLERVAVFSRLTAETWKLLDPHDTKVPPSAESRTR